MRKTQKISALFLSICCSINLTAITYANSLYGDMNGDAEIDVTDAIIIMKHDAGMITLNQDKLKYGDVNQDGETDIADAILVMKYDAGYDVDFPNESAINISSFTYGKSELGRDLICYSIEPENYSKTILLEFEIHGFEDSYAHDGQDLVDTANELIKYYSNAEDLNNTRLLIIPSANPDGLIDGTTNNGFGRCNVKGIDLNRDFDANYKPFSTVRNYTQSAFSAVESRALRDLCTQYKPDIVIDFHGWESSLIGDIELCVPFKEEMGLRITHAFTSTNANGYFSNWAHQQGALAMLVEFTSPNDIDMERLKNAINRLINDQYDNGQVNGDYSILENKSIVFMAPQRIDLPNDENGKAQYISQGDICLINSVDTENALCEVTYPSGGSNVFTTGQKTKEATIKLSYILSYLSGEETVRGKTDKTIKVYPTSAMTSNGTNWSLDPGDVYYIINQTDESKAVLYYCSTGAHATHWKIGWVSNEELN